MATKVKMLEALEQIKTMNLSPGDTFMVQLLLTVQEFCHDVDLSQVNTPFEEWSLTDMCRVLKVEVNS